METNQYWSMTEGVFNCLIDKERSLAFKKAIQNTVKKGDVVVDMGTGSGILAMFAADAGASRVYAIEIDPRNVNTLKQTFEANGYTEIIHVIHGDATTVKLPEKVNVIVGEMIATALIEELQVPAMNNMLNYVCEDYKVILQNYETFIDLVHSNESYYGHDFKIIRYEYPDLKKLQSKPLSNKMRINEVDFRKKTKKLHVDIDADLVASQNGNINGLRLSGITTFHDNSTLGATFAYDYPLILPISTREVRMGDKLKVQLKYKITGGIESVKYKVL